MRKIYIILILILLAIVPSYLILKKRIAKKENYTEIKVERRDIISTFRINGTIEPRNRLPIKPQVAGRIEEILVVEGQKVRKGEIIAWLSSTERAALLDIAKSQGEQEYKKWQEIYKPTPVIAPLDGFIIVRNKEPGQTVSTNDNIVVMADELIVKANVDETDLRYVKLNQPVKVSLDAYPDIKFSGIVEHIAYESTVVNNVTVYEIKIRPVLNPTAGKPAEGFRDRFSSVSFPSSRSFERSMMSRSGPPPQGRWRDSKEIFDRWRQRGASFSRVSDGKNFLEILRSGMSATVEIVSVQKRNTLVLPVDAIIDDGKEKYVLVKNNKKPQRRVVETGIMSGKDVEIITGVKEGEVVLVPQKEYKRVSTVSTRVTQQSVRRNPMSAFFRR